MRFSKNTYLMLFSITLFYLIYSYFSVIGYFFIQDDFFHLHISNAQSLKDFIFFFVPRGDIIGYRPISIQLYFFLTQSLLGVNNFAFHSINIFIFLICVYLIYEIAKVFKNDRTFATLAAFFWTTSSLHFMSLAWISAAYQLVGTVFFLAAFLAFTKYRISHNKILFLASIIFFVFSLLSFEIAIALPIIIFSYLILIISDKPKKVLLLLSPFLIISFLYLSLRIITSNIPDSEQYKVAFNIDSIKAFFWYLIWSLNIPDEFKYQSENFILPNAKFIKEWGKEITIFYLSSLTLLFSAYLFPILIILKSKLYLNSKNTSFFFLWFIVTISPVCLLPYHTNTMYLSLPSVGLYLFMSNLVLKTNLKILVIFTIATWLLSSMHTISFYKKASWIVSSQRISKRIVEDFKRYEGVLVTNSTVYYPLIFQKEFQAISYGDAVKVFYSQKNLNVYFFKNDLENDFKNGKVRSVNYIVPDEAKLVY